MTNYGGGAVLGAATVLPATSAFGILLQDNMHPAAIVGFMAISVLSLVLLLASVYRYFLNVRKGN